MLFLANENFPGEAVEALRQEGHDVAWVRIDAPGASDQGVLKRAQTEARVLLTFAKDFGELAFRAGLPAACGVMLFRIPMSSAGQVARVTVAALRSRQDWAGHFSVIEQSRIRMTALPQA